MKQRFFWLDLTRGFAIVWIFLVHFTERFQCCPMFANPNANWPTWNERFNQMISLEIDGLKKGVEKFIQDSIFSQPGLKNQHFFRLHLLAEA